MKEKDMTATPMPVITEGQLVVIDHAKTRGMTWVVEKVKYTKAIVRPANEAAKAAYPRGLDAQMTMLRPADGPAPEIPKRDAQAEAEARLAELELQMQFELGVLVRIKQAYGNYTTSDLFVVTANNEKTVSVVKIGGDGGRYLRVPHKGLTIVPVADAVRDAWLA
jgi:hypothetical protein